MAYMTYVSVQGLAGRSKPVEIELDRHLNIFWGLNGSGKTSLLRIMHAALMNDPSNLDRIPFRSAEIHFYSESAQAHFSRQVSERSDGDADRELLQVGEDGNEWIEIDRPRAWRTIALESRPRSFPGDLLHTYLPISRVAENRGPRRPAARAAFGNPMDDNYFDQVFADQVKRRWQTYNSEANAAIRNVQQQGLAEILSVLFGGTSNPEHAATSSLSASTAYDLVTEFLRQQTIRLKINRSDFVTRYKSQKDLPAIVSRIQDVLSNIEIALAPQEQLQRMIEELYAGDKQLVFDSSGVQVVQGGENRIPLGSLSSGEKQLLQILLETLASGRSPVIVDEPELSMHVDWQHKLVGYMRTINDNCQILLATHSPEVMATVPNSNIFEL